MTTPPAPLLSRNWYHVVDGFRLEAAIDAYLFRLYAFLFCQAATLQLTEQYFCFQRFRRTILPQCLHSMMSVFGMDNVILLTLLRFLRQDTIAWRDSIQTASEMPSPGMHYGMVTSSPSSSGVIVPDDADSATPASPETVFSRFSSWARRQ